MNRRAEAGPFVELMHLRARQQPVARGVGAEFVGLLRRDNRPAQRRLHRRHLDHCEAVHRDPGGAREQRTPGVDRRKAHGVTADAADNGLAFETVVIDVGQRDCERRRGDTLGLDERQPRHTAAGEGDAVHADVALLDVGRVGRRIDDRLRRNRHRRGKRRRLERERHRPGRNQLLNGPALARRRGLVPRDDLADRERLPGVDAHAFCEMPFGRRHADDGFAARERHSHCARDLRRDRHRGARGRHDGHRRQALCVEVGRRAGDRRSARRPCRPARGPRARSGRCERRRRACRARERHRPAAPQSSGQRRLCPRRA